MGYNLSDVLDYSLIEDLAYSECDRPHDILGAHLLNEGFLVATFLPDVISVRVCFINSSYDMIQEYKAGFFAILLDKDKEDYNYYFEATYADENVVHIEDPYRFLPTISYDETKLYNKGIWYDSYKKMGAHYQKIGDVYGTSFAVWAPFAKRVSVVGDFNFWNGLKHQMRRLGDSGIFELFIPDVKIGSIYKYEIKAKDNLTFLKADPYANTATLRPDDASIVADMDYDFTDDVWIEKRKKSKNQDKAMAIYELHLGSFATPNDGREFYNYRELAPLICDYIQDMGYTHIELMPIMEHPFDGSWGYQVTGYYAPTKRYGDPTDFMYFVDYLHQKNIGIIIDWVPAHFPRDTFALSCFDGTCLYEHQDPRQGAHPHWGTLIFNYGRAEVSNFLISNALYWADVYHIDGIRFDAVASMLYLDYGKSDGQWVANRYGGRENLEAIEFIKHLNSIFKSKFKNVSLIAEESTAWEKVTGSLNDGGLGFDFKWNMGWMNDVLDYMKTDPLFRREKHNEMTFSMVYAYSENYILPFSHDEVVHLKCSMINKMPGDDVDKFANLRTLYTYMMAHPGKKLLFMGQDFGQRDEWMEDKALQLDLLKHDSHRLLQSYVRDLLKLYIKYDIFYKHDYDTEGFRWIDCDNADENLLSLIRYGSKKNEFMVFIFNFSGNSYEKYKIGVPNNCSYKLLLNSQETKYYGIKDIAKKTYKAEKKSYNDFAYSIEVNIPKFSALVFLTVPSKKIAKKATKKITGK